MFISTFIFPLIQGESKLSGNSGNIKTKLSTLCCNRNKNTQSSEVIQLPVPYQLPPQPYTSEGPTYFEVDRNIKIHSFLSFFFLVYA